MQKKRAIILIANRNRGRKGSRCYLAGVAEQADARDLKSRDT